jgi:hypothetical protein
VARPGGDRAHPGLRRGLHGGQPPAHRPPTARLAGITRPTLVATGGASPDSFLGGGGAFFDRAADAIAASIPHAERRVIEGQTHMVDPKVLAPVLERFFAG